MWRFAGVLRLASALCEAWTCSRAGQRGFLRLQVRRLWLRAGSDVPRQQGTASGRGGSKARASRRRLGEAARRPWRSLQWQQSGRRSLTRRRGALHAADGSGVQRTAVRGSERCGAVLRRTASTLNGAATAAKKSAPKPR